MHELVNVLDQQSKITADAMHEAACDEGLEEYWIEINRLENDGDRAYRMLLVRLFSGEYDALTVLKMKEVATSWKRPATPSSTWPTRSRRSRSRSLRP